jgi:ABC-2 type transport system ATP-binding protein
MTTVAISMRGVAKRYGAVRALDGLDVEVQAGEIFGFLGPNGAGKTTAMRIIMGLAASDAGTTQIFGAPPGSPAALAASGALIETPALYPSASGREHLRRIARWAGVGPARVEEVLSAVGLAGAGAKRTQEYSLGMKQRLGLATALLKNPSLLVLDEPANGLDPAGMKEISGLLVRMRDAGHTVMLSSHLLGEVEQVADRVGIVASGRMVLTATPRDLRERAARRVLIDARPVARAARIVRTCGLVPADVIEVVDAGIAITLPEVGQGGQGRDAIVPRIVQALVKAGLVVHRVETEERSLTEIFLELTGAAEGER